jgi:hypothetical protein
MLFKITTECSNGDIRERKHLSKFDVVSIIIGLLRIDWVLPSGNRMVKVCIERGDT